MGRRAAMHLLTVATAGAAAMMAPAMRARTLQPHLHRSAPFMAVAEPLTVPEGVTELSGLQGKALLVEPADIPTKAQIREAVPAHCFQRDTLRSMRYAVQSVLVTAACAATGLLIPLKLAWLPVWLAYGAATGTAATGAWVVAHECGHGAFSDNRKLQTAVGYVLHSALLVPYFSWQRSHAVHHANTNHITQGETHVPLVVDGKEGIENVGGEHELKVAQKIGSGAFGALQLVLHLVIGWPAYLLWGATGGPKYGTSNHFWPSRPFSNKLWPANWPKKVLISDIGVVGMLGLLAFAASKVGLLKVLALYGLPLLFVNMWLVGYTWLQHTDVDVPHLGADDFSYMRGAFLSIDRPYGKLFDWLHHRIGSTHVAHHIDCTIPHYHAREATDAVAAAFPKAYLYDPTPVHKALWRVASKCVAVKREQPDKGRYLWVPPS